MRTKVLIVIMTALTLAACQQGQAGSDTTAERLPPKPLIEPIDPSKDPVSAVKARKQQMTADVNLNAMRGEIMALIGDAKADLPNRLRGNGGGVCEGALGRPAFQQTVEHAGQQ